MNEQELIELLSVYRHRQPMPVLSRRSHAPQWIAAAAAVVIIGMIAIWMNAWRDGWRVLRAGETISRPARIERRGVGYVDIAADTLVDVERGDRLSLRHGTIHAKTTAPP